MQRTSAEILHNFHENISQLKNLSHLNVFISKTLTAAEEKVNEAAKRKRNGELNKRIWPQFFCVVRILRLKLIEF